MNMGLTTFKSHVLYILWVWNLTLNIALRQGENKNTPFPNNNDHNTTYVFASMGTHDVYVNLDF